MAGYTIQIPEGWWWKALIIIVAVSWFAAGLPWWTTYVSNAALLAKARAYVEAQQIIGKCGGGADLKEELGG